MTYTMFDQVFWRAISGQVNRFRKEVCGIGPTNFDKLEQHKSKSSHIPRWHELMVVPFLYNFSPSVVHPPLDWTEWIHVTGYWFLENADESAKKSKWTPPDGLLDFIDTAHVKGKKVVYMYVSPLVAMIMTDELVDLDQS
jgi:sterol 3beta-glucosyltransferase